METTFVVFSQTSTPTTLLVLDRAVVADDIQLWVLRLAIFHRVMGTLIVVVVVVVVVFLVVVVVVVVVEYGEY